MAELGLDLLSRYRYERDTTFCLFACAAPDESHVVNLLDGTVRANLGKFQIVVLLSYQPAIHAWPALTTFTHPHPSTI